MKLRGLLVEEKGQISFAPLAVMAAAPDVEGHIAAAIAATATPDLQRLTAAICCPATPSC
ncbi:MAG: hypothetical protein R3272_04440 [Candidatus Promineifilaceae bacterium]|nr:hypothetical protein [Candidatus Promineifilaceae bacterium]